MLLGTLISAPYLVKCWILSRTLAKPIARWLILSFILGTVAIVPGLLRRAGVPDSICDGWWMNTFLFYPLLNSLQTRGLILGCAGIIFLFAFQYGIILIALIRTKNNAARREHDTEK